jgi:hypothetical protein
MRRARVLGALIGSAALLTAPSGCGSGAPYVEGSTDEATVQGTAKVQGKLLEGGTLHFNASNPKRNVATRDATIGKDGTYTVKAYIGLNIVSVTPPKPRNKQQGKDFHGLEYEEKSVNVRSGENTVDLEFLP